jgi:hypothetical protein
MGEKRRGRPRTRAARECRVYLDDPEVAAVEALADACGLSRAEWVRRVVLGAVAAPPWVRALLLDPAASWPGVNLKTGGAT